MLKVEFLFSPKDMVLTPLDDLGVIYSCSVDPSLKHAYYVHVKGGAGQWYFEDQLKIMTNTSGTED